MKTALPLSILLLLGSLLPGCVKKEDAGKKDRKPEAVLVEVAALERGPIEATWKSSTSLEAEAEVRVLSQAANRVTELLVEEGSRVEKDDVLLRLESDIQKIAMDKAQASFEKANEEFQRQEGLFKQKLVSEEVYKEFSYNLRQLELDLADATRAFNYTTVKAPIRGTISTRLAKLGDYVTAGQHLFDIVDFDSLVARVYPPETFIQQLATQQVARVRSPALGDAVIPAYVRRISPVVLGTTGTFKVTVGFNDVQRLRPGMYVDVEIVLATFDKALLIPKRALVYDGDQTFVYRLAEGRKAERLLLETKLGDQDNVTPVSGFSDGDQIVVAGQTGLKDGASVRLPGDPKPVKEEGGEKKETTTETAKPDAKAGA